jgi:hypothetical protein
MRCRDAKFWLTVQRDDDPIQSNVSTVQEHLRRCGGCRSFEQGQKRLDTLLPRGRGNIDRAGSSGNFSTTSTTSGQPQTLPQQSPYIQPGISTERIMLAIQERKRITQQLEDIRTKQQSRMVRLHRVVPSLAVALFVIGTLPLLLFVVQPHLGAQFITLLSGVIELFITVGQYVQTDLMLVTGNSLLLSGVALVLVVMMGLWLRLMRSPQEAV